MPRQQHEKSLRPGDATDRACTTNEKRNDMGTFRVTMEINRPATDVFAFVAEPRNMPRWYEAVERVAEVTPRTPTQAAQLPDHTVVARRPGRQHRRSHRVDAKPHGDIRKPRRSDAVSLSLHGRAPRRRKPAHPRCRHLERRTPRTTRPSGRRRNPSVQAGHATQPRGTEASRRIECPVALTTHESEASAKAASRWTTENLPGVIGHTTKSRCDLELAGERRRRAQSVP